MRLGQNQTLRAELRRRGLQRVQRFDAGAQALAYADHLQAVAGVGTSTSGRDTTAAVSR